MAVSWLNRWNSLRSDLRREVAEYEDALPADEEVRIRMRERAFAMRKILALMDIMEHDK